MSSLGFDLLDRHVIDGGADDPAAGALTFARLLERSAALGTGLRLLGVTEGGEVAIDLSGEHRVVAVCACIRIGALPGGAGSDASVMLEEIDGAAVARTDSETHPLDLVRRAGSGDPAVALATDGEGFRAEVAERVGDVVEALLARRPAL